MAKITISKPVSCRQGVFCLLLKRSSHEGFTLIELLVVTVIVGVLAAIALPAFSNQATRAKNAEGKLTVGNILRGQHAYYTENGGFSSDLDPLGLGIRDSNNYQFDSDLFTNHQTETGDKVSGARARAVPKTEVRGYMGKVWVANEGEQAYITSTLCEGEIGAIDFMKSKTYCP